MAWFSSKKSPSPAAEPVAAVTEDPVRDAVVAASEAAPDDDVPVAVEEPTPPIVAAAPARAVPDRSGTRLGEDTTVVGGIVTASALWIAGRIEGDIASGAAVVVAADGSVVGDVRATMVQVDEGGTVRGTVTVGDADIAGVVQGAVRATARLAVASSGRVIGDVTASTMQIDDGATLQGRCTMVRRPAPSSG